MLLSHLTKYDFINQRTEQFDGITTRFNTTDKLTEMFESYIDSNPISNQIFSFDINALCEGSASKSKELKKYCLHYSRGYAKLHPNNRISQS